MAINVNQALMGQPIRTRTMGEALTGARANPRVEGAPSTTETELAAEGSRGEEGLAPDIPQATASSGVGLMRAVEQANALAESKINSPRRSVSFDRNSESGRITITINEEVNGEETTREIPPTEFQELYERLQDMVPEGSTTGALVNLAG